MSYWEIIGGQIHAEPSVAPVVPSLHQIFAGDVRPYQVSALPNMLKEARQLDCGNFDGTSDAMVAKNWLKMVPGTCEDMGLVDEMKMKVAVRLLENEAKIWWENLKGRTLAQLT